MTEKPEQITVPDRDPQIVTSPLSHTVARDGVSVELVIYRRVTDPAWSIKVINQNDLTTHITGHFETEQEALKWFQDDIEQDGIESYVYELPHCVCPTCRASS